MSGLTLVSHDCHVTTYELQHVICVVIVLASTPYYRTASTIVTITLRDVNDETPMFVGAPYTGMIMEGSPPDNFVVAVSATDPDLGDAIVFAIEEGEVTICAEVLSHVSQMTIYLGVVI